MQIIDGRKISEEIIARLKSEVAALPFQPVFCDVLVGDDPASAQYVRMKAKMAEQIGIKFRGAVFPGSISTLELVEEIKKINQEPNMSGLIVQLPLPLHLDKDAVLNAIDSKIDVDCTGKINSELFYQGKAFLEFPTAAAVMEILDSIKMDFTDKQFLVIGFGQLVGRPVSYLLEQRGFKVEVARSKTENILELIKQADVIISAVGKAKLITGDKIKKGSIIVDAGTSEGYAGGIVGDVDFDSVSRSANYVSPVPGGVGPVTVACLLRNVLKAAKT